MTQKIPFAFEHSLIKHEKDLFSCAVNYFIELGFSMKGLLHLKLLRGIHRAATKQYRVTLTCANRVNQP